MIWLNGHFVPHLHITEAVIRDAPSADDRSSITSESDLEDEAAVVAQALKNEMSTVTSSERPDSDQRTMSTEQRPFSWTVLLNWRDQYENYIGPRFEIVSAKLGFPLANDWTVVSTSGTGETASMDSLNMAGSIKVDSTTNEWPLRVNMANLEQYYRKMEFRLQISVNYLQSLNGVILHYFRDLYEVISPARQHQFEHILRHLKRRSSDTNGESAESGVDATDRNSSDFSILIRDWTYSVDKERVSRVSTYLVRCLTVPTSTTSEYCIKASTATLPTDCPLTVSTLWPLIHCPSLAASLRTSWRDRKSVV